MPGVVCDDEPPPQAVSVIKLIASRSPAQRARGACRRDRRYAAQSTGTAQISGAVGGKRIGAGVVPVVAGAVVPMLTVTEEVAVPLSCTEELERMHVGGGVTCGVMAQVRLMVPEKELAGVKFDVNVALCPAVTVWAAGAAVATEKSGGAVIVSVRGTLLVIEPEVPTT